MLAVPPEYNLEQERQRGRPLGMPSKMRVVRGFRVAWKQDLGLNLRSFKWAKKSVTV
jgi:hypothetical protein